MEIARVSSSRTDKKAQPHKLIKYLIDHSHWSPFEHAIMTVDIETSRGIAAQILRHRSCTFQEFSQRYQDVTKINNEGIFEHIELRQAGATNRQSSLEVFDPQMDDIYGMGDYKSPASKQVAHHLKKSEELYIKLLEAGVATECARFVLPLATRTRIYVTGNVRSWIHFLALRDDDHAQKEIRLIAREVKKLFIKEFPHISKALGYEVIEEKQRKKYVKLSQNARKALKRDAVKLSVEELAEKYEVTTATVRNICKS